MRASDRRRASSIVSWNGFRGPSKEMVGIVPRLDHGQHQTVIVFARSLLLEAVVASVVKCCGVSRAPRGHSRPSFSGVGSAIVFRSFRAPAIDATSIGYATLDVVTSTLAGVEVLGVTEVAKLLGISRQ